jgi:uncharacterized protein (DUF2267 family)
MDDLIANVVAKTGISDSMARNVVTVVVDHLKGTLPAPIAAHLDAALGTDGAHDIMNIVDSGLGSILTGSSPSAK